MTTGDLRETLLLSFYLVSLRITELIVLQTSCLGTHFCHIPKSTMEVTGYRGGAASSGYNICRPEKLSPSSGLPSFS